VGLGLVLRRNEEGAIFVKETIQGFAAQRQGGVQPGDVLLQVGPLLHAASRRRLPALVAARMTLRRHPSLLCVP
jgi:C-terminal processing protease CtpA/Prc